MTPPNIPGARASAATSPPRKDLPAIRKLARLQISQNRNFRHSAYPRGKAFVGQASRPAADLPVRPALGRSPARHPKRRKILNHVPLNSPPTGRTQSKSPGPEPQPHPRRRPHRPVPSEAQRLDQASSATRPRPSASPAAPSMNSNAPSPKPPPSPTTNQNPTAFYKNQFRPELFQSRAVTRTST